MGTPRHITIKVAPEAVGHQPGNPSGWLPKIWVEFESGGELTIYYVDLPPVVRTRKEAVERSQQLAGLHLSEKGWPREIVHIKPPSDD